jgi:hypothetical protein
MAFKYRARSDEDREKRAAGGGDFVGIWKPEFKVYSVKDGANAVRILPPTWDDAKHYGWDVYVHYQIGPQNQQVLCLAKTFNKACPVCEAKLRGDGGPQVKGEKHPLAPTRRVAMWVMDNTKPEDGPMIWGCPQTLDTDIVKVSKDRETGQYYLLDHPTDGYVVFFDKTGDQRQTKYLGVSLARRPSSVADNVLDYVERHPLPDCLTIPTYADVLAIYEGGVPGGVPEEDVEPEASRERPQWDRDGRQPQENNETGGRGKWEEPPPPDSDQGYGSEANHTAPEPEPEPEPERKPKPSINPKADAPAGDKAPTAAEQLRAKFAAKKAAGK